MPPIHPDNIPPLPNLQATTLENAPHHLIARSSQTYAAGSGTVAPTHINMKGLMALFALIGAAFVLAAIWFFFWAKNGGFIWRKGDWEEYKSTVLRRKGPDGRTLSNATKSTKLGGGSVYHKGYTDDGYTYADTATNLTEKTGMAGATADPERKRRRKLREKFRRRRKNDEVTVNWENDVDEDVAAYRKEKAARVGGINRDGEGTYYGSDYDLSNPASHYNQSEITGSQVRDYAYDPAPARASPSRKQSKRRDFSFVPGSEEVLSQAPTHDHRARESSTRRHNRRRERRRNPPPSESSGSRTSSPRKRERPAVRGHYTEALDFSSSAPSRSEYQYSNVETEDSGTKSYHHPIPGLSKGYRREGGRGRRRDSLSESD
ncbi:hypothetical protein BO94DRAFT_35345 [Aspergillus sclerotioniger CBS 115572]|uniref:Endosomal SPRY domain protein n=1 Tax=Aspergillus sclerotioniger CBS 115572 TaxID=1450535 RepID=A0A317WWA1_9EURO|nr:hypothetical protein BO94DRAFT_35345 [Aspergillus sclerotioniger CBS 115572]PWY89437.1 hypothetical protein BO94DRAFT_35345 [Aspergillus sclerotioniger CBS 115572]